MISCNQKPRNSEKTNAVGRNEKEHETKAKEINTKISLNLPDLGRNSAGNRIV